MRRTASVQGTNIGRSEMLKPLIGFEITDRQNIDRWRNVNEVGSNKSCEAQTHGRRVKA